MRKHKINLSVNLNSRNGIENILNEEANAHWSDNLINLTKFSDEDIDKFVNIRRSKKESPEDPDEDPDYHRAYERKHKSVKTRAQRKCKCKK